jgi:hypothetical protein
VGVPHGVGAAWGLVPTSGRRPDHVPADRGPVAVHAWAGPRRKRGGRAQMNSMVLDLFKLI